jgi:predicted ATPase/Tfp pilus assembly protein PilF
MSELTSGFQLLPPEYQRVLQAAQDQHVISVTPLETLVGGWSGAMVFLVSVTHLAESPRRVEHLVLKLDRKSKTARSDELVRHAIAQRRSPSEFARDHLAALAFERVEAEGAIAIFYSIAGQSLQAFRPLSAHSQQHHLETIFAATYQYLLGEWNVNATYLQAVQPRDLLEKWLGFRLGPDAPIETFLRQVCRVEPDRQGFLIQGSVFPNPLTYARHGEVWGSPRPIDAIVGLQHGDLNTNNILVQFSADERLLTGYYLIDFALFKEDMPLLYDLRYLEMSYLIQAMAQVSFARVTDLILHLAEGTRFDPSRAPVEMAGVSAVISIARAAFERWLVKHHPSLEDDLWGQYWLAGVAAGLSYCHKAGQAEEQRMAGLLYAAANLKRYFTSFSLALPTDVEHLYSTGQSGTGTPGTPGTPLDRKPHHNLPTQPTPFIGRSSQVSALKELLLAPSVRLVTLLGPGGTGKTRLSLQAADEMLSHFPHGVYFVPLADDRDSTQFISRVAQQLEVREGGRPLLENVKDYLREKRLLLVLDNFEQLMSAASVVSELLAAAPRLKIMTSSRVPLKLHGEHEYPVPPLELPELTNELSVADLAKNEAVFLFVERARASNPNFILTKDNASAVADICRRLDGLPLALELAAARVKLLPPQAILTRLADRFKLLTGGPRDLPSRHQALRNTLEWSYSLLNEEEKTLYARLGVFVGGFTLEAAEAICNAEGSLDVLENLASLADNSLLRQEELSDGEPRFGMLETIRAYALERLTESGELETLRERHARYFGSIVVVQNWLQLTSANALAWINWLEREYDNIRATLAWCLSSPQGIDLGGELVFAMEWFWYRRGYFSEGGMWSERMLQSPVLGKAAPERALALLNGGAMAVWQGKQELGLAQIEEGLALGQRQEDERLIAMGNLEMAVAYINMGQDEMAKSMLAQARAFFREQNQPYFHAITTVHIGNVELGLGNPERAHALHQQALGEARAIGESWLLSFALNNLGEVARTQGQYDLARKYYEECEALLKDTGDRGDMARFVHTLGYIAQHEGDYAQAEAQFRKSLTMFRQLGNRRGMAECMAGLAGVKARQGHAGWGAIMLSAAESLLKATGGAWWPADRGEVEANQTIIRSALSETELAAAQAQGRAMTLEQALVFASEG